jgi:hypothetical protein
MWPIVCLLALFTPLRAQVDILHLRDGSRHCRTLLYQGENGIFFRIFLADGAGLVRSFPMPQVERLDRATAERSESRPTEDARPPQAVAPDFEQMLREAYELVEDDDRPAALRALGRIVTHAPDDVLEQLDRQVRAAHGQPLDEFLADTRIRVALEGRHGRLFDLNYATPFEADALGKRLEQLHARLLGTAYHGRTIKAWAGQRDEYAELQPDARHMITDARRAAAVLGARLRFDPRLKKDRAERRRLLALRADLARFTAKVSAMPGFTSLGVNENDADDPTLREARRLAAEQAAASQPAGE